MTPQWMPQWVQEWNGVIAASDGGFAAASSATRAAVAWAGRGRWIEVSGQGVFVVDVAARRESSAPPMVLLHGFPTSSIDWAEVIDALAADRRVIAIDYPGFGLSDKPDHRYTMAGCADAVVGVLEALKIDRLSLVTHDMGDTVGGELLARNLAGTWNVKIVDRVLTNGSIYLDLAHLTAGQQFLASLPDEKVDEALAPDAASLTASLVATLGPTHQGAGATAMAPAAELLVGGGGAALLARLIRYLEERRDNEAHFTGAIERHPSPVTVVWGALDPIARVEMVQRFGEARPDAHVTVLDGVGHYPMVEASAAFVAAVQGRGTSH